MNNWAKSLVRISNHEVETLQKRLSEIVERRVAVQMKIAVLDAEVEEELANSHLYEASGIYLAGYRDGSKIRRAKLEQEVEVILTEEAGARDALTEAFETLKKYEHVIEAAKVVAVREENRRETAALDELGLRKAAGR
jgi:flagellar protein FliJ